MSEKKKLFIFFTVCFLIIIVIYGQTIFGDFVFDDRWIVDLEPFISKISNLDKILLMPYWSPDAGTYRPITLVSYMLSSVFLGNSPAWYHLINIILYFFTAFLLFLITNRLFKNEIASYITAIVFILLPIHSEVVSNITGRSELLALFFSLLAIYELTREKINFWRVGIWIFLGVGSKETAIATVPLCLLVLYLREKSYSLEAIKKHFLVLSSLLIGALTYMTMRLVSIGPEHFIGANTSIIENPLMFTDWLGRGITALKILGMYLQKTIFPLGLCSDYSYNQIPVTYNLFNPLVIVGIIVFIGSFASIFYFLRRQPAVSFGSLMIFFGILPVSNIFFPIGTIAGERLFYYPSAGVAIIIGLLAYKALFNFKEKYQKMILYFFVLLSFFYVFISYQQANEWLTEKRLFIATAKCAPDSTLALSNLGAIFYLNGEFEKAKDALEKSREINPTYSKGLNNLGLVYSKLGDKKKARELYREAMLLRYPYNGVYENMAILNLEEGREERARVWLDIFLNNKN